MSNNSKYDNLIGAKLRDFFTKENKELNNGFLDFSEIIDEIEEQIVSAKDEIKNKQNINLHMYDKFMQSGKRLNSAVDEIDLIKDSTNQDFYEYITNLARIVDIMNNIGHVYQELGNNQQSQDFMFAKNVALLKLAKECLNNNEKGGIDIVFGLCEDNTKSRNKNGFIIDLPGIGQISWHTIDGIANVLKMYGVTQYPYEMIKNHEHTNCKLLNLEVNENELNEHQQIVTSNINNPEQIRKKLDEYYSINKKPSTKEQIKEAINGRDKKESYRKNLFVTIYDLLPPRNKQDSIR